VEFLKEIFVMRSFAAGALALSLVVSTAAGANSVTPMAPGKPAGVKQAQVQNSTMFVVLGVGLLAAGIGLAASGDSNVITPAPTTTTTTTTSTTATTTTP